MTLTSRLVSDPTAADAASDPATADFFTPAPAVSASDSTPSAPLDSS